MIDPDNGAPKHLGEEETLNIFENSESDFVPDSIFMEQDHE